MMDSETARIIAQMQSKLDQLMSFDHIAYTPPTNYTPTLYCSSTNPTGQTVTGRYIVIGKLVQLTIRTVFGPGLGTGSYYSWSLPFQAANNGSLGFYGGMYCFSAGNEYFVCIARIDPNANVMYGGYGTASINPTNPSTFVNGNVIKASICYEKA